MSRASSTGDARCPIRSISRRSRDVGEAQQVLEHEPGMAGALADAAIGDDSLVLGDAVPRRKLAKVVGGLESAVLVAGWAQGMLRAPGMSPPRWQGPGPGRAARGFAGELIRPRRRRTKAGGVHQSVLDGWARRASLLLSGPGVAARLWFGTSVVRSRPSASQLCAVHDGHPCGVDLSCQRPRRRTSCGRRRG